MSPMLIDDERRAELEVQLSQITLSFSNPNLRRSRDAVAILNNHLSSLTTVGKPDPTESEET